MDNVFNRKAAFCFEHGQTKQASLAAIRIWVAAPVAGAVEVDRHEALANRSGKGY